MKNKQTFFNAMERKSYRLCKPRVEKVVEIKDLLGVFGGLAGNKSFSRQAAKHARKRSQSNAGTFNS